MNRKVLSFFALILIMLASCAKAPPPVKEPPVFFPGPPDPPRIQFLKSYRSSLDLAARKSAFWAFVTGGYDKPTILDKPYGIAGYKGKIYVCDTNKGVMVIDLEKSTLAQLRGAQGLGKLMQPLNISIDKEGNKYVTDVLRSQVVMFDKNDFYVKAFGPVEGWKPTDAVAFEGLLYVVDIKSAEVKVFDIQSGALRNALGNRDDAPKLGLPTNIAFDSQGYFYVSDLARFQVVKYDRDGSGKGTIGSLGKVPGSFSRPKGLALDRNDRLYVVDAAFNNVQMFSTDGQLLLFFGKGGKRGPGDLYLPAKVSIDYDDVKYFQKYADPGFQIDFLILVSSQFGERLVSVYGFGTQKEMSYKTDEELLKERKALEEKERKEKAEKEKQDQEQKEKQEKELKEKQEHPEKTGDAEQKTPENAEQKKD